MIPINEIHERYNRRTFLLYPIGIILFVCVLILYLIGFNIISEKYNLVTVVLLIVMFYLGALRPDLSTFELIRYHFSKLIKSMNENDFKKSESNLDSLAYNLENLNDGLEDIFILYSSKETLNEFRNLLKYQVYPSLIKYDFESYIEVLKDIELAFENGNITLLNKELKKYVSEKDDDIILPSEKSPILSRIIKSISSEMKINFQNNFVFRLVCIAAILFIIGYFVSTNTLVDFNSLVGPLIVVAAIIAKEI